MRINSTPAFAPQPNPERPDTRQPSQEKQVTTPEPSQEKQVTTPVQNEVVENAQKTAAQSFLSDFGGALVHGGEVGAATHVNSMLVDGVLKLFPVGGLAAMALDTDLGRKALRITLPLGLGLVASLAPSLIPNMVEASLVRTVCLRMAEGEAAQIVRPALERMGGLLKAVVAAGVRSGMDLAGADPKGREEAQKWAEEAERDERNREVLREEAEKQRAAFQQTVEAAVRAAHAMAVPAPVPASSPTPEAVAELVKSGVLTKEEARFMLGHPPAPPAPDAESPPKLVVELGNPDVPVEIR